VTASQNGLHFMLYLHAIFFSSCHPQYTYSRVKPTCDIHECTQI